MLTYYYILAVKQRILNRINYSGMYPVDKNKILNYMCSIMLVIENKYFFKTIKYISEEESKAFSWLYICGN